MLGAARLRRGEPAQLRERLGHLARGEERRGGPLERDRGPPLRAAPRTRARERVGVRGGEPPPAGVEARSVAVTAPSVSSGVAPRERRGPKRSTRVARQRPRAEAVGREHAVARSPSGRGRASTTSVAARRGGALPLARAREEGGKRLEDGRGADRHERLVVAGLGERAPLGLDPDASGADGVVDAPHVRAQEHAGAEHLARVPLVEALAVVRGDPRAELALARGERAGQLARLHDAAEPELGEVQLAHGHGRVVRGADAGVRTSSRVPRAATRASLPCASSGNAPGASARAEGSSQMGGPLPPTRTRTRSRRPRPASSRGGSCHSVAARATSASRPAARRRATWSSGEVLRVGLAAREDVRRPGGRERRLVDRHPGRAHAAAHPGGDAAHGLVAAGPTRAERGARLLAQVRAGERRVEAGAHAAGDIGPARPHRERHVRRGRKLARRAGLPRRDGRRVAPLERDVRTPSATVSTGVSATPRATQRSRGAAGASP